ncbi:hypothetical protein TNCV_1740451 [Trichonephila clavipes]|uniref:Mos1 transposase HTH domain-containing protein n=1 Tax=Trichonephila clavipes TaxID=2585209 RepID=A0A8X6RDL7_TRICX|nr:hypothetical protein TNCV_1740451 [Trichonephila clavipes]
MRVSQQHFYATRHSSSLVVVGVFQTFQHGTPFSICNKEERRTAIHLLFAEDVKLTTIIRRMQAQYDDSYLSRSKIYEWIENFK